MALGMGNGGFRHASEKKTGCVVAALYLGAMRAGDTLGPVGALAGGIASICDFGAWVGGVVTSDDCRL